MNTFYRAPEVSKIMRIGLSTVWLYAKQGKLHPVKFSSRVTVFLKSDVDAYVTSCINQAV